MGTRSQEHVVLHQVEATAPGGKRLNLVVQSKRLHRGSVKVHWDPTGAREPCFPFQMPWNLVGVISGIVVVVVAIYWMVLT